MGGKGHKQTCKCRFCGGKGNTMEVENNENDTIHIRNWSRSKCEDQLASLRFNILTRVSNMSKYWEGLVELNKRKEKVQERLAELGVSIRNQ